MRTVPIRFTATLAGTLLVAGCALTLPPTQVPLQAPAQWQAPLPHQGQLHRLSDWWRQQDDPLLLSLMEAAQAASPSVTQALARLAAARATQISAHAALLPQVDAAVSASRGLSQANVPLASTAQAGLQAAWELDLVGANRTVSQAASAQVDASQAQWHHARVAVAAEVANLVYGLRTCTQLLALVQQDAQSRQESARLTDLSARAGFAAPASAALAQAAAAEARSRVSSQATQCELNTKALVELTALSEPDLKRHMAQAPQAPAQLAPLSITRVPAQALTQRPDVFAAEREVVMASAQVGSAQAQRYPRLTLNGAIGVQRYSAAGVETDLNTWSFGPLALTLPVLDGGRRAASVAAAEANYQHTVTTYQGKVRQAVREVEEALVSLHSTEARRLDAALSTQGYAASLAATQARYGQGLASLVELEEARRTALAAESAQLSLQLERKRAWVALYRALGGGWTPAPSADAMPQ